MSSIQDLKSHGKIEISKHRSPVLTLRKTTLRIDNRRQSVIRATLHCSPSLIHTISYHIPNDCLYFCLSYHVNDVMIDLIFRKLLILNQFFDFYFFEHGYLAW